MDTLALFLDAVRLQVISGQVPTLGAILAPSRKLATIEDVIDAVAQDDYRFRLIRVAARAPLAQIVAEIGAAGREEATPVLGFAEGVPAMLVEWLRSWRLESPFLAATPIPYLPSSIVCVLDEAGTAARGIGEFATPVYRIDSHTRFEPVTVRGEARDPQVRFLEDAARLKAQCVASRLKGIRPEGGGELRIVH